MKHIGQFSVQDLRKNHHHPEVLQKSDDISLSFIQTSSPDQNLHNFAQAMPPAIFQMSKRGTPVDLAMTVMTSETNTGGRKF